MKKCVGCFCLMLGIAFNSHSQVIVEDAKGQSSILFRNSNVSLNLTEATLSAAINNFRKIHFANNRSQFLWQIAATGKNEEGFAKLWNDGNLNAASKLQGFLGVRVRGYKKEYELFDQRDQLSNAPELNNLRSAMNFRSDMISIINNDKTLNLGQKKSIRDTVTAITRKQLFEIPGSVSDLLLLKTYYNTLGLLTEETAIDSIIQFLNLRQGKILAASPDADSIRAEIEKVDNAIAKFRRENPRKAANIFLDFGMNASSYTLFARPTATPFATRFDTTKFRGGFFDIGINYDMGAHWVFGIPGGYERANTFDTLSKKDYTERTSETSGTQSFISEKKYTAYSGFYDVYDRISIKSDLLYFGTINNKLKATNDFRYVWNILYTRWYLPMNNDLVKGIVNIGTGINFYKQNGKFVGGLYLEQNDVANNLDKQDSDF